MRIVFDKPYDTYNEYCSPNELLSSVEITALFKIYEPGYDLATD
jgi:hypothetical protein